MSKGNSGGKPGRSGRRPGDGGQYGRSTRKRYPNFLAPLEEKVESGAYLNNEVDGHIDHLQLGGCGACGCVWWSDYTIDVRSAYNPICNKLGDNFYLIIDSIKVKGFEENHSEDCLFDFMSKWP